MASPGLGSAMEDKFYVHAHFPFQRVHVVSHKQAVNDVTWQKSNASEFSVQTGDSLINSYASTL